VKEREEEERYKAEETHNGEGREKDIETSDNTAETENGVSLDTLKGADEACDTTDNDIAEDLNSTGIFRDDTLLSTDNAVDDRTSTLSSAKTETDLETDVSGEEEDKDATTEPTEMLLGPSEIQHENIGEDCIKDKDHGLVDKNKISNGVLLQCEPSEPTDGNMCSCDGEVIRFTFGSNLCALPTVCEETPYDLTGPTDCEETPYDLTGPTDDGSDTCESCDLTDPPLHPPACHKILPLVCLKT
jgi:hypothetical protein